MSVTIIGSGVAGLASAIALKQQGFEPLIFERTSEQSTTGIGAGIVLWPNAMFVLEQLGLLNKILKVSAPVKRMRRFNHLNLALNSMDIEALNLAAGFTSRSILRADLMAVLQAEARALDIKIHYNHELTDLAETSSGIRLSFNHSHSIYNCQTLIGADGRMKSTLRKFLLGDNAPVYQKFINVIGISNHISYRSSQDVLDYWGAGARFGIVPVNSESSSINNSPELASQANAYWAAGWYSAEKDSAAIDSQQLLNSLKEQFKNWPAPVKQALLATDHNTLKKLYIHDHTPDERWSKGNILMIGDAAHAALPTSGQGACQALEDAWWLAKITAEQEISPEAFTRFSAVRQSKTKAITQSGRAMARTIFNPDTEACKIRDINLSQGPQSADSTAIANFWMQGLA